MKNTRQEPVFLLEMPHALRHMIMRRGLMLRSGRTRTLCCMNKTGPKAWLEAKLILNAGESAQENWDKAHELSGRFKRELHADVYVEPACEFGRFKEMTSPQLPLEFDGADSFMPQIDAPGFAPHTGPGPSIVPGLSHDVATGFAIGHNSGNRDPFGMGAAGMPHIPDPMRDILPPQVRQLMGTGRYGGQKPGGSKRLNLTFPALRELPGSSELSETKQKMFEVEAAQLHQSPQCAPEDGICDLGANLPALPDSTIAKERALAKLIVHPQISAALKRFLLESFEALTAKDGSTNRT